MNKEFWNKKWLDKYIVLYKDREACVVYKVLDVFKESYYKPVRLRIEPLNEQRDSLWQYKLYHPEIVDANKVRHATPEELAKAVADRLNPPPKTEVYSYRKASHNAIFDVQYMTEWIDNTEVKKK
jgi:hypothetical protein